MRIQCRRGTRSASKLYVATFVVRQRHSRSERKARTILLLRKRRISSSQMWHIVLAWANSVKVQRHGPHELVLGRIINNTFAGALEALGLLHETNCP